MVDADGAIAGVINYLAWPTSGDANPLVIVNAGTGGATYNGAAVANRYSLLSTGATSFANTASSDNVAIPHGAAIDNFSTATFEWVFKVTTTTLGDSSVSLIGKDVIFQIGYDTDSGGYMGITRTGDELAHKRYYEVYNCGFSVGNWYYVQVTWDCSGYTNVPIVKINNVAKSVTDAGSTTVTAWDADAAHNAILWNAYADPSTQTVAVFRWHDVILSDANLISNYNLTKWRIPSEVTVHMTVPDVVADEGTTIAGRIATLTALTCTSDEGTITPARISNPTATLTTALPTVADEGTVTPSIVINKTVSLTTVPNATTGVSKISSVSISVGTILAPNTVANRNAVTPSITISAITVNMPTRGTVADVKSITVTRSLHTYLLVSVTCPGCVADECRINTPLLGEELVDTGLSPVYLPVSALNSFTNTENEIIALRNTGTTDTYTVTVGPTEYTPTIVADRCAFLGPFDIVTYGTKPEITYDSLTNLEIIILKIV